MQTQRRGDDRRAYDHRNPRKSITLTLVTGLFALYALMPLVWLVISSTKTQTDYVSTFGFAFGSEFALFDNIAQTFAYRNGIFGRWFLNTLLYVVVGAGGARLLAILGGYGLAKFRFPGRRAVIAVVMGAIAVPSTALTVPLFLMFSQLGLVNTPWAVIIPSLITPFGFYLMWVFSQEAVPDELLEAANPDIDVDLQNVGGAADTYTKLDNAIAAGSGAPDIAQVEYYAVPQYAITGRLADLGAGKLADNFTTGTWNAVTLSNSGSIWGLPVDSGPMALFYNKAVFDQAGITEAPKSWDEYHEAAKNIRALVSYGQSQGFIKG